MSKGYIRQWVMKAKFESVCNETGNHINEGETILYIPESKHCKSQVFCKESTTFKNLDLDPSNVGYKSNS